MEHNSTQFPENILFQQTTCQVSASSPSGQNSEVQTEAQDSSERGVFRGGNKNIPAGTLVTSCQQAFTQVMQV